MAWASVQIYDSDAIANTEFTITAPKNIKLFYNDLSRAGITYSRQEKNNQQILTWKGKNLPKVVLQDSMPRDEQRYTQLRASTMSSWQDVARWAKGAGQRARATQSPARAGLAPWPRSTPLA